MDEFQDLGFTVKVDNSNIYIEKAEAKIFFSPGEADTLCSLLSLLRRMVGLPALPPVVSDGQFQIKLRRNGTAAIFHDGQDNGISFDLDILDSVIELVKKATSKYVDYTTLRGGPRKGVRSVTPEIVIEGR